MKTPRFQRFSVFLLTLLCAAGLTGCAGDGEFREKALRFLSLRDGAVRAALAGGVLLGINCGLLGGFLVARRMAMLGDTLSHAVLPGIAGGFLWNLTRDPVAMLTGALITGTLSSLIVGWIGATTRLKPDAALSVVLTVFFAAGIALIKILPDGDKAGLDRFLYGQAAALGPEELKTLGAATAVTAVCLSLFYRGLLVLSFDRTFGESCGLSMKALHYLLMFLTTLAIVVSMQAVGVILVSGLLVIPAATAWLLTDRLHRALFWSAGLAALAAVAGAFLSFTGERMALGPTLILCSSALFFTAFLFSPRHGLARRAWTNLRHGRRVRREDALKAAWQTLEAGGFRSPMVPLRELAARLRLSPAGARAALRSLKRKKFASPGPGADFRLTPSGFSEACRLVRNHRLWELYLNRRAGYAEDHVHDDAEEIEHLLAEENVRALERALNHPVTDPHGKRIPSAQDTFETAAARHEADARDRSPS